MVGGNGRWWWLVWGWQVQQMFRQIDTRWRERHGVVLEKRQENGALCSDGDQVESKTKTESVKHWNYSVLQSVKEEGRSRGDCQEAQHALRSAQEDRWHRETSPVKLSWPFMLSRLQDLLEREREIQSDGLVFGERRRTLKAFLVGDHWGSGGGVSGGRGDGFRRYGGAAVRGVGAWLHRRGGDGRWGLDVDGLALQSGWGHVLLGRHWKAGIMRRWGWGWKAWGGSWAHWLGLLSLSGRRGGRGASVDARVQLLLTMCDILGKLRMQVLRNEGSIQFGCCLKLCSQKWQHSLVTGKKVLPLSLPWLVKLNKSGNSRSFGSLQEGLRSSSKKPCVHAFRGSSRIKGV